MRLSLHGHFIDERLTKMKIILLVTSVKVTVDDRKEN